MHVLENKKKMYLLNLFTDVRIRNKNIYTDFFSYEFLLTSKLKLFVVE